MNAAEDAIDYRPLRLSRRQLNTVARATQRTPAIARARGIGAGNTRVGVQVFDYSRSGGAPPPVGAGREGNAILLTRMDENSPSITWWILTAHSQLLPMALRGTFYGSTARAPEWYR